MDRNCQKTVLVIMAHPDDEVLACGGAIAKHTAQGDKVYIYFLADGVTSRQYDPDQPVDRSIELERDALLLQQRKNEACQAAGILGVPDKNIIFEDLKDQRLDTYALLDLTKKIEKIKAQLAPAIVYTHFSGDLNLDHCLTARAVMTAFRPKVVQGEEVYLCEVPESTYLGYPSGRKTFIPNHFVDITAHIEHKIAAINQYHSEVRVYPDKRSGQYLRELALERGSLMGVNYAEAFIKI